MGPADESRTFKYSKKQESHVKKAPKIAKKICCSFKNNVSLFLFGPNSPVDFSFMTSCVLIKLIKFGDVWCCVLKTVFNLMFKFTAQLTFFIIFSMYFRNY